MTDKPEPELNPEIEQQPEEPEKQAAEQPSAPLGDVPPPLPRPFIAFIFAGPTSAEFEVQRHPMVSTMMLSPVKDYLETLLMGEYGSIHMANERRRQEEAQKAKDSKKGPFTRRLKELAGGQLFKKH
jgi:hypothetical protein